MKLSEQLRNMLRNIVDAYETISQSRETLLTIDASSMDQEGYATLQKSILDMLPRMSAGAEEIRSVVQSVIHFSPRVASAHDALADAVDEIDQVTDTLSQCDPSVTTPKNAATMIGAATMLITLLMHGLQELRLSIEGVIEVLAKE